MCTHRRGAVSAELPHQPWWSSRRGRSITTASSWQLPARRRRDLVLLVWLLLLPLLLLLERILASVCRVLAARQLQQLHLLLVAL